MAQTVTLDVPSKILSAIDDGARYQALRSELESIFSHGDYVRFSNPPSTGGIINISFFNESPIMLPRQIDFNNWKIVITGRGSNDNLANNVFLFEIEKHSNLKKSNIHVTKENIESQDFSSCKELSTGKKILILQDLLRWSERQDSSDQVPVYRRDILLIENGRAKNQPIFSYSSASSALNCWYYDVSNDDPIIFKNLNFERKYSNNGVTKLLSIANYNDISIENVSASLTGVANNMNGDACFRLENCSNVTFKNITISNTFSTVSTFGYGISMDNVYNSCFYNVTGTAQWGIFGNYFINRMFLSNCVINRLDVHTYGKDIRCENCTFQNTLNSTNIYNQFSGLYGTLHFQSCTFIDFIPVLLEPSFSAYSGFDIFMCSCTMSHANGVIQNKIIKASFLSSNIINREELSTTSWPNIHITDLSFSNYPNSSMYIFFIESSSGNSRSNPIHYLSQVSVSQLNNTTPSINWYFSNKQIYTIQNIKSKCSIIDKTINCLPIV